MNQEGLVFYPSRYYPPLGYPGFDVWLSDTPSRRYFDAHRILFPIEVSGALKRQTVEHPWSGSPEVRFVIGRIRLEAHDGDYEEVYSFGGLAAVSRDGDITVCRVASTAPFLPLNEDPQSPMGVLESELEILLAERRARWGKDEYSHLDHLGHTDPLTLFRVSIQTVERRLKSLVRPDGDETLRDAARLARGMREQLVRAGEWPADVPELDDIL